MIKSLYSTAFLLTFLFLIAGCDETATDFAADFESSSTRIGVGQLGFGDFTPSVSTVVGEGLHQHVISTTTQQL